MKLNKNVLLIFFILISFVSCTSTNQVSNSIESNAQRKKTFIKEESFEQINSFSVSIFIKTDVPKSNVYLNNIFYGKTPLLIEDIIPGLYNLKIVFVEEKLNINSLLQSKSSNSQISQVENLQSLQGENSVNFQSDNLENSQIEKHFLLNVERALRKNFYIEKK